MDNSLTNAATVSGCPVCGQGLSYSDSVCDECGAILALRMARGRRPTGLRSHLTAVHRRFAAVSRFFRDRHGFYIVTALLTTALTAAVIAGVFARRSAVEIAPRAERSEANRSAVDRPQRLDRRQATVPAAGSSAPHETRPPRGWTSLGMVAAAVLGTLFSAVAVSSGRRRRHDRAAETRAWSASTRMTQAAAIGAAFCLGLAVALLVVVSMGSPAVEPSAALATMEPQHDDPWRRETSTLSHRLSALDARLASLESTRPASSARPEGGPSRATASKGGPRSVEVVGEPESSGTWFSAAPADDHVGTSVSAADVLRPPRVAAASLRDRVWEDIVRDWEHVKRTVRELLPRDAR